MKDKLKALTGYDKIVQYFTDTKWYRKIFDCFLIIMLLVTYGLSTGKISVPEQWLPPKHTVEASLSKSKDIQKVLDVYQYMRGYTFVGHFIFHDGQSSLIASMPFMKFDLFEYSTKYSTQVNPLDWKDVPIQSNLKMVSTMSDDKQCYVKDIIPSDPLYNQFRKIGIDHIVACPYFDKNSGRLVAFVMIGVDGDKAIDVELVKKLAAELSGFQ